MLEFYIYASVQFIHRLAVFCKMPRKRSSKTDTIRRLIDNESLHKWTSLMRDFSIARQNVNRSIYPLITVADGVICVTIIEIEIYGRRTRANIFDREFLIKFPSLSISPSRESNN